MLAGPMLLLKDRGEEGGALLRGAGPRSSRAFLDGAVWGRRALVAAVERPGVHVGTGGFPVTDEGGAALLSVLTNGIRGSRVVRAEERRAVLAHVVKLRRPAGERVSNESAREALRGVSDRAGHMGSAAVKGPAGRAGLEAARHAYMPLPNLRFTR